jgi:hypothetical protein
MYINFIIKRETYILQNNLQAFEELRITWEQVFNTISHLQKIRYELLKNNNENKNQSFCITNDGKIEKRNWTFKRLNSLVRNVERLRRTTF